MVAIVVALIAATAGFVGARRAHEVSKIARRRNELPAFIRGRYRCPKTVATSSRRLLTPVLSKIDFRWS